MNHETIKDTVIREVKEETGSEIENLKFLRCFTRNKK
ncbi:NUDIX domain-containing protein [Lysinibacillus sp. RC79]